MNFSRYAWGVLAWNVLVIMWGALVRATGSGAGCGSHWPLCDGAVIPRAPQAATLIEFTHRLTSGVALLAVAGLLWWAWRAFPKHHLARKASAAAAILILVEALLGAGLVLLNYVEQNRSLGRAAYLSAHLTNTLLLVGSIAAAAWLGRETNPRLGAIRGLHWAALVAAMLAGISGAIAALGDTLFPAVTFVEGMRAEFATDAHELLRLRLAHPVLATLAGAVLLWTALRVMRIHVSSRLRHAAWILLVVVVLQLVAGVVNVALLAPVWMQLLHLGLAVVAWASLVLVVLEDSLIRARN